MRIQRQRDRTAVRAAGNQSDTRHKSGRGGAGRGRFCRTLLVLCLVASGLGMFPSAARASTDLVKQLTGSSIPDWSIKANGHVFFELYDPVGGSDQLWKSDGTEAGTVVLKGGFANISGLTNVAGTVYFSGEVYNPSGPNAYGLWKSDGTTGGTVLVKSVRYAKKLTNISGKLYFTAERLDETAPVGDETSRYITGLWTSDGTEAGTVPIKEGINIDDEGPFIEINGTMFFAAYDPSTGMELWKSDGTEAGTVMVEDIDPGSTVSSYDPSVSYPNSSSPSYLKNVGGTLFFKAADQTHGAELWKSDGTEAGTVLVKDINPGSAEGAHMYFSEVLNGKLYFLATEPEHGGELWVSDGTEAGTQLVADTTPGPADGWPQSFVKSGDAIFFAAGWDPGVYNGELWATDGTSEGTRMVKDINPGFGYSTPLDSTFYADSHAYRNGNWLPWEMSVNGELYFDATDGVNGRALWKTDGTEVGTSLVADIDPGVDDWSPAFGHFYLLGSRLVFFATASNTLGLWKTDVDILPVDTTPPETTIASGPADGSTQEATSADFTYSSSETNFTFHCSLSTGADSYSPCPSGGQSYSGLTDGTYTFKVKATDAAGNTDPTPASRTFTVVTIPSSDAPASGTNEVVTADAAAGEAITTDPANDGANADDPVETTVVSPVAGAVSIEEGPITETAPSLYQFFGQQVNITAPVASAADPLALSFRLDSSVIPAGETEQTIELFRNGVRVLACTSTDGSASPDPCVFQRVAYGDGDIGVTVLTSRASAWNFGVRVQDEHEWTPPPPAPNEETTPSPAPGEGPPSPEPSPTPSDEVVIVDEPLKIESGIWIRYRTADEGLLFTGRVSSERRKCVAGRVVVLKKVLPGKNRIRGKVLTFRKGWWRIENKQEKGRFYAVARRFSFTNHAGLEVVCQRVRSETLRVRIR